MDERHELKLKQGVKSMIVIESKKKDSITPWLRHDYDDVK